MTMGPVKALPAPGFVRHGRNAEMRWGGIPPDYLTPNDHFFVRSQGSTPIIDRSSWRLSIEGPGVHARVELTFNDLSALPKVTYVRALECAGNGRRLFARRYGTMPKGNEWGLGAIGVARWTGVRLREVLECAGIRPEAHQVMPEGLDDIRMRRPMPLAKALEDDTLVAYEMNGEPLPMDHGAPARVLVSGWAAVASVKWLGRIEVSVEPLWTRWNTAVYIMAGKPYSNEPVEAQVMKSTFELDADSHLLPGPHRLKGRAWSPDSCISKVEVSIDGSEWRPAQLIPPNLRRAWVRFTFAWDAEPGVHLLQCRCFDTSGAHQSDDVIWNDHGYLYGGTTEQRVTVADGASVSRIKEGL